MLTKINRNLAEIATACIASLAMTVEGSDYSRINRNSEMLDKWSVGAYNGVNRCGRVSRPFFPPFREPLFGAMRQVQPG